MNINFVNNNTLVKVYVRAKVNEINGTISYRTSISSKNKEGKKDWITVWINPIGEAKNKPIDDNTAIYIKQGFLSFDKIQVKKIDVITGQEVTVEDESLKLIISDFIYEDELTDNTYQIADDDSDLPF